MDLRESSPKQGRDIRERRILIVEDNEGAAWGLGTYLIKIGCAVENAFTGTEALGKVAAFKPDSMLVDIGLPDMDGCELIRILRDTPGFEHIRLVAVTGYSDDETSDRIDRAGFDSVLIKPVNIRALLEHLRIG